MAALAACRTEIPPPSTVVADAQGLPDCAGTYTPTDVCSALDQWASREVEGFNEEDWNTKPVRWIGSEESPAFCSDDMAEAEAYVEEHDPDPEGGRHTVWGGDPRWTDIRRLDENNAFTGQDRVMRCDFLAELAAAPPGVESVPEFAEYVNDIEPETDFFPVMREMSRWRQTQLTMQIVLSFGEAQTESSHLRVCDVRCGTCEDPFGPVRNVTGIVETQDWVYDPATRKVSFEVAQGEETACETKY